MSEQRRFGESDHEPLREDDILAHAIGQWRDELPQRDLWPDVAARLRASGASARQAQTLTFTFTLSQLAVAASFLIAVVAGVTWLATNRSVTIGNGPQQDVIQAYSVDVPAAPGGRVVPANFADAQFNAAVEDLERILREERGRLDPRTVLILERNLKAIDAAIHEARMALEQDPANPFLNSHLADARRRKLDLLRHATELASAGGD
ncbi:MAG TPA: hypothetical protein VJ691_12910 [Vicinamibacterales bacterium]|nr:hypothetical protein [Vicinamibacterales bacterium]